MSNIYEFESDGITSLINTSTIPGSVTQTYRKVLVDYHPNVGARMKAVVNNVGNCLKFELEPQEWPDGTKLVMESLEFVETPTKNILIAKPGFINRIGEWTLNNVLLELMDKPVWDPEPTPLPAADFGTNLTLQWSFPGHEHVFTSWKCSNKKFGNGAKKSASSKKGVKKPARKKPARKKPAK